MRLLLAVVCLFLPVASLAQESPSPPKPAFSVTRYKLAFVNVGKQGEVVNEYIPHGETLENWTTMIAVRQWPQFNEMKEVVGPYVRRLQPLYVRDAQVYRSEKHADGSDLTIEFYLAPQDKSYLEYNLIRFVREEGAKGVKSYQFAVRGSFNVEAAVEFNQARLKSRLDTLASLTLAAETEMPQTEEPTTTVGNETEVEGTATAQASAAEEDEDEEEEDADSSDETSDI